MSMVEKRKKERINLVLNTIKTHPDASKTEIKKISGLSMEVVLQYIDYLTEAGLIRCSGAKAEEEAKVGRRADRYRLDPDGGKFLGVKFTARRMSGVVTDFCGDVIATYELERETRRVTPQELMERIFHCIDRLTETFPIRTLTAIGLAAPGFVNSESGELLRYNNLLSDVPLPLKAEVEKRYGVPVFVDGTTRVKAIAYHLNAGKNIENFAYIFIGSGCTSAYIYKDSLYRGGNGFDGELGHLPVFGKTKECSCGKKGCLETVVGNGYIVKEMQERGRECRTIEDFVSAFEQGDAVAAELMEEIAACIAYAVSAVITLYDPRYLVLCGDYVADEKFKAIFLRDLERFCLHDLFERTQIRFIKNQRGDNASDAALLCYYNLYYNKTLI